MPEDRRAGRDLDRDDVLIAAVAVQPDLVLGRLAGVAVATGHHGQRAALLGVVGQRIVAVADLGVGRERVGRAVAGVAVQEKARPARPLQVRAQAGEDGVLAQKVVDQRQHLGVHHRRLEHRVLEQEVGDELEFLVGGLVLEIERLAFPRLRDLDDAVAQRLDLGGRERVLDDGEAEGFELGQVRLEPLGADLAVDVDQIRRRRPVADVHWKLQPAGDVIVHPLSNGASPRRRLHLPSLPAPRLIGGSGHP